MKAYPQPEAVFGEARWITVPGPHPDNCTFLARRGFTVAQVPRPATLHIAAEARYAVCLNGRYLGSGPARGTHYRYFYDSYEAGGSARGRSATPSPCASTVRSEAPPAPCLRCCRR